MFDDIKALTQQLMAQQKMLVTAESCTGGGLAQALTDLANSSSWFERGYVTYSNAAKEELLDVKPETLAHHGAVSEACAREMAEGALKHSHADLAIAITGIAGPTGGSHDKPVGTVWFAWTSQDQTILTTCQQFDGDRLAIRHQAIQFAITILLKTIKKY